MRGLRNRWQPVAAPIPKTWQPGNRRDTLVLLPLVLLMALAAAANPPVALSAEQASTAKRLAAQPWSTLESAADIVRRETGGRVLSVTPLEGGHRGYRVRVLLDGGRVTTILVDPQGSSRRPR